MTYESAFKRLPHRRGRRGDLQWVSVNAESNAEAIRKTRELLDREPDMAWYAGPLLKKHNHGKI